MKEAIQFAAPSGTSSGKAPWQLQPVHPGARQIDVVTRGRQHGPITRLVSPSNLGQRLKPFVFLDHAVIEPSPEPLFGMHPHSGIATVTVPLRGALAYEDTTGKSGELPAGGVEWMKAGNGVWHDGRVLPGETSRGFQLWVALPPSLESSPAESEYVAPGAIQSEGPARVILGSLGRARSAVRSAPPGINYFHVQLQDGERWVYQPPYRHTIAWVAVDKGQLRSNAIVPAGAIGVFEDSNDGIKVRAEGDTSFVFGSAIKHPHPLVLGNYSVHTSNEALIRGETEIRRIGKRLRDQGRF